MSSGVRRGKGDAGEAVRQKQESLALTGLARDCRLADIGRNLVAVRLSRLEPDRLRAHHLRLARAALEPLLYVDRARLFELPGRDLVVAWRGPAETARSAARSAILHLFVGDDSFPIAPEQLWEDYKLPDDAEALFALARGPEDRHPAPLPPQPLVPLDPASLAAFELQLAHADMARFARRFPVGALQPAGGFTIAWEKRRLDIGELSACLSPSHDLTAEPWLFRRLTRTLDRRMLSLLSAHGELADAGPFSLHLNIASLLSPEFLRFDAGLPSALRGKVSIDLSPEDILADSATYLFARDFVRPRGYRLTLTGLSASLLPMLPTRKLGLDLVHLRWSGDLATTDLAALQAEPARVVLSGVDDRAALAWGVSQGIGLYAGRIVAEALRARPVIAMPMAVA